MINIEVFLSFGGYVKRTVDENGCGNLSLRQQVINGGSLRLLGLRKLPGGVSGVRGACGKGKVESGSWNQKKICEVATTNNCALANVHLFSFLDREGFYDKKLIFLVIF